MAGRFTLPLLMLLKRSHGSKCSTSGKDFMSEAGCVWLAAISVISLIVIAFGFACWELVRRER
jgi:hypothetical protein